jgi:hypothetical protein
LIYQGTFLWRRSGKKKEKEKDLEMAWRIESQVQVD